MEIQSLFSTKRIILPLKFNGGPTKTFHKLFTNLVTLVSQNHKNINVITFSSGRVTNNTVCIVV